jgi:hypothetical protein
MRLLSAETRAQWTVGIVLALIAGYLDGYGLPAISHSQRDVNLYRIHKRRWIPISTALALKQAYGWLS